MALTKLQETTISELVSRVSESNDVQFTTILETAFDNKCEFGLELIKSIARSSDNMKIRLVNHPLFEEFVNSNMDTLI